MYTNCFTNTKQNIALTKYTGQTQGAYSWLPYNTMEF